MLAKTEMQHKFSSNRGAGIQSWCISTRECHVFWEEMIFLRKDPQNMFFLAEKKDVNEMLSMSQPVQTSGSSSFVCEHPCVCKMYKPRTDTRV